VYKNILKATEQNQIGINYANNGNYDLAIIHFRKALELDSSFNSYFLIGLAYQMKGNLRKAEIYYQKTLRINPKFSMAYNNLGAIYSENKDFKKAVPFLISAIKADPANAFSYNNLGNAYKASGNKTKAVLNWKKAIKLDPNFPEPYNNLGIIMKEDNKNTQAVYYLKKALLVDPKFTDTLFHLGVIYANTQQFKLAVEYLEKYVQKNTTNGDAFSILAGVYENLQSFQKAIDNYEKAIGLIPNSPGILNNLGNLYKLVGQLEKSVKYYHGALKYETKSSLIYSNLGASLIMQGKYQDAIKAFNEAIKYDDTNSLAYYNLGLLYSLSKELALSAVNLKKALKISPSFDQALSLYTLVLMQICDWKEFQLQALKLDRINAAKRKKGQLINETPFLNVSRNQNPKENFIVAQSKSLRAKKAVSGLIPPFSFIKTVKKRIRIGYLSRDYYDHPTAYLILNLFKLHNRKGFEVYVYSYGPDDKSQYLKKIKADCDKFIDISKLSFVEAAQKINADEIDILVDLKGHTQETKLEILALKPSPIQIHYLGFPGTIGADYIDYIVADKIVIPQKDKKYYSEKIIYLPNCYQINDDQRQISEKKYKRADFGLPENAFVFSSFNNTFKITPETFKAWVEILKNVPGSVLWIIQSNRFAQENLKKTMLDYKIDPKRLITAKRLPNEEHLARISLSNLGLDTFTYNGHTTTSDSLWAGVPVVTLQGKHFASRVASSILTAIGLPELITHSSNQYIKLATELALNKSKLDKIKNDLSQNRLKAPLFNTEKFVLNLEKAYEKVWQNYLSGAKPKTILVTPNDKKYNNKIK
jgi:protein O-GlcNAc transferase